MQPASNVMRFDPRPYRVSGLIQPAFIVAVLTTLFIVTGFPLHAYLAVYFFAMSFGRFFLGRGIVLYDDAIVVRGSNARFRIEYAEITKVHFRDPGEGEEFRQRVFAFMRGQRFGKRELPCVHFARPRVYLTMFFLPPIPWLWLTKRLYLNSLDDDVAHILVEELVQRVELVQPDPQERILPSSHRD